MIRVEVSYGELIDKITILEIKKERIRDAKKLQNVNHELELLKSTWASAVAPSKDIDLLTDQLRAVNVRLWDIEDDIRACERAKDFGETFVRLARAVYHENDQRAALKAKVNEILGSTIREEKSYSAY